MHVKRKRRWFIQRNSDRIRSTLFYLISLTAIVMFPVLLHYRGIRLYEPNHVNEFPLSR